MTSNRIPDRLVRIALARPKMIKRCKDEKVASHGKPTIAEDNTGDGSSETDNTFYDSSGADDLGSDWSDVDSAVAGLKEVSISERPQTPLGEDDNQPISTRAADSEHLPNSPQSIIDSNRVFEIKKSDTGGLGAFARSDIQQGTTVLVENMLFSAKPQTLYAEIDKLTPLQRQAYFNLHAHRNNPTLDDATAIFNTNSFTATGGSCIFLETARFNHACSEKRNVDFTLNLEERTISLTAIKPIKAGQELTICYGHKYTAAMLEQFWGFRCRCGGCKQDDDESSELRNLDDKGDKDQWERCRPNSQSHLSWNWYAQNKRSGNQYLALDTECKTPRALW